MDGASKALFILIILVLLVWILYPTKQKKKVYRWQQDSGTLVDIPGPRGLYCGFFGKQKVISKTDTDPIVVTLGCECDPMTIENGTFDITTGEYTCEEGYERWFDANKKRYRIEPGLREDVSLRELYAKKPDDQPYCVPVKNTAI